MISFMGDRYDLWLPPMVYRSVFAETYDRKRFLGTSPHWVSTEVTYMPWLPNGSCSIALGNIFTAISPNGEPIPDLVPHSLMEGISSFWNEGFNTDLVECMMGNPLMRHLLDNKSMNEEEEVNAYLERLNEGEGHDSEEEYDLLTAYLTAWESMSREEILDVVSRLLPDSPVN